ncbi:MAG: RNA polymerase sigma factor [Deltaproteobacteria bacterium]|nr:RNA polymerase sigma factor [Deltaproteobacteria bacterium]
MDLITRVQEGRPGAFDELYYAYVDRVHRKLHAVVGPDPELDDLIQQTFLQIHGKIGEFRGECAFATWLHRVALNVALMHLRKRQRWLRFGQEPESLRPALEPAGPAAPDDAAGRREKLELLHGIVGEVKPKKRIVFVLYHVEGHTLEEIAELTEASVNTVASRLRAARKEVRRALERRLQARGRASA